MTLTEITAMLIATFGVVFALRQHWLSESRKSGRY